MNQIPLREYSNEESAQRERLLKLEYPKDRIEVEGLSAEDFRIWLYSMSPLQALNLASTRKFAWMRSRRNAQKPFDKILRDLIQERDFLKCQLEEFAKKWWFKLFTRRYW